MEGGGKGNQKVPEVRLDPVKAQGDYRTIIQAERVHARMHETASRASGGATIYRFGFEFSSASGMGKHSTSP